MFRWSRRAGLALIVPVSCGVLGGCAALRSAGENASIERMVSEYEQGVAAAEKVPADSPDAAANILVPYQQARRCRETHDIEIRDYPDVEVETSRGKKTLREMAGECLALEEGIRARSYRGCGERRFVISSNVDGTGAWTRPAVHARKDEYIPVPCERVPQEMPGPVASEFETVHPRLQQLCGPTARIYYPREWDHRTNALGVVVRRESEVICLVVDETRPTWWLEDF